MPHGLGHTFWIFCLGVVINAANRKERKEMSALLPVRGTQISCAPCSVERAAGLLRKFLSSDAATEAGIIRGYVETVAQTLDDMVARSGVKNVSRSKTGGLTFDYPGEAEVVTKRLQKTEVKKTKKKVKALSDFEALLGNENEKTTYGVHDEEEHGELGREEKSGVTEMLATSTRGSLDGHEDYEGEVIKKSKKKKDSHRDMTMSGSPAKVQETPGSDRKKKKKHKGNFEDGDVQAESGSGELATEELISEIGVRGREEKVSGSEESKHKKKIKKRASQESPGDANDQPRKSKKSRVSN